MASTTTITAWIDQLAGSILPALTSENRAKRRKLLDTFRKHIRHHNYGRTNQFDVKERLDGLEEKFQILDRDDLSDSLYERRLELGGWQLQWIPDALDLVLRLSNDPTNKTSATVLHGIDTGSLEATLLKANEAAFDDSFDEEDPIWRKPQWSDLSSDEDEVEHLSSSTSQSVQEHTDDHGIASDISSQPYLEVMVDIQQPQIEVLAGHIRRDSHTKIIIDEVQLIRELLLYMQGFPTVVFTESSEERLALDERITLQGVSSSVLGEVLVSMYDLQTQLAVIRRWLRDVRREDFLQVIYAGCSDVLAAYSLLVGDLSRSLSKPRSEQVVSLLGIVDILDRRATPVRTVSLYIQKAFNKDPISCLEILHDDLSQQYYSSNKIGMATMLPIFIKAFIVYVKPIITWVESGVLSSDRHLLFVRPGDTVSGLKSLWNNAYELDLDGPGRPPIFLRSTAKDVYACGKTAAFASRLVYLEPPNPESTNMDNLCNQIQMAAANPLLAFPAALISIWSSFIASVLADKTAALKILLDKKCGLNRVLDALSVLYLAKDGMLCDAIDDKTFKRIDQCRDNWNDRFLFTDILEDVYARVECIDLELIVVRSIRTSSRSMRSRRRSVKIMGALATEYSLPWPVANIITEKSMRSYYRLALHLAQLRRTRYVLEHIARPAAWNNAISDNRIEQKQAQVLSFMLINFANTLYDHFTAGTIGHLTKKMRIQLENAQTVDDMIEIHNSCTSRLNYLCLLTKKQKVLRDVLLGLLDMCIRFADVLTSTRNNSKSLITHKGLAGNTSTRKNDSDDDNSKDDDDDDDDDDFETSSFISADTQTWRRRKHERRQRQKQRNLARQNRYPTKDDDVLPSSSSTSSDSEHSDHARNTYEGDGNLNEDEDDDISSGEGEGYSSFIVLEETTTVFKEIMKLQTQFQRQLEFFIAGLKGISRVGVRNGGDDHDGGEVTVGADEMEILAERLTWKRGR